MKTLKLLPLMLFAALPLAAQQKTHDYKPSVVIVSKHPGKNENSLKERAAQHYRDTHVTGFQQSHLPNIIFSTNDNKFMLALGGYVEMRAAYDFNGIVDDIDFVTRDIPIPGSYDTRQKLTLSATTSRMFLKAIADTKHLGRITAYIETDFRGYDYNLRLRLAYITAGGFLLGQNVTTFCDLDASPTTVDFQGPNAYDFVFNTMIRFTHDISRRVSFGAAVEMPSASATYGSRFARIHQRVPDLPLYMQVNWGRHNSSHLRASAVLRDICYEDLEGAVTREQFAWGVKLSGNIEIARKWNTFMQAAYGRGITPYIQDLAGSGLDLVPDPADLSHLQTPPMMGWFAAGQYNINRRTFVSGGYSQVRVWSRNGYFDGGQYRSAQYVFGNIFYTLAPGCTIAMEYLYGTRKNMNGESRAANRMQAMVRYRF